MLTSKTQDTPFIGVFKLATGEEFIAKVVEETMLGYKVEKPLCMVQAERGLAFAPLMMMADSTKSINIPKPVITATPAPELAAKYEGATSTIALPKKSGIIA